MIKQTPIIEVKKSSKNSKVDDNKSDKVLHNRTYTIKDMSKSLQGKYAINFQETSYDELKEHAVSKSSYLLDIACDIKELLEDNNKNRHDYIKVLLECYTKQAHLERFQKHEREKIK